MRRAGEGWIRAEPVASPLPSFPPHSGSDQPTWDLSTLTPRRPSKGSFIGFRRWGSPTHVWISILPISFLILFFLSIFENV